MNQSTIDFIKAANAIYGENAILTRTEIQKIMDKNPHLQYPYWLVSRNEYRVERGQYKIPPVIDEENFGNVSERPTRDSNDDAIQDNENNKNAVQPSVEALAAASSNTQYVKMVKLIDESEPEIPLKYKGYVPFGFFNDLKTIIQSQTFFPVFLSGLSGNGKTLMVEQACSVVGRKCIKINVSVETDQTDLLGGPILVNGSIVNRDGPVILAMRHGAILLLDEIDRGSNKLMCLQSILEGAPYFNKNTGEMIYPQKGFNIIATANTKGKGSEDGRYLATILDDAFLERFPNTIEQEYPTEKVETKILTNELEKHENIKELGQQEESFIKNLVSWAKTIRKAYEEGSVNELISTRRLVHIIKSYAIYKDKKKSIILCTNRFDDETKKAFIEFYEKLDSTIENIVPYQADSSLANIWEQEVNNNSHNSPF